ARRSAPQDETALPHVQRLHDRASQRACLGLLPAGSVFREARARCTAETDQEDCEGGDPRVIERRRAHAAVTAFLALFSIVGIALYGLPFFYDFFVRDLGWTRAQVTSGNALSKVIIGPLFGFAAGWTIDRFGPRRLMLAGIVMAGAALVRPEPRQGNGLRVPRHRYRRNAGAPDRDGPHHVVRVAHGAPGSRRVD